MMSAEHCDFLTELRARGLENLMVRIMAHLDLSSVTSCLQVNSVWASNLRDIWRQLFREQIKHQAIFRNYCVLTRFGKQENRETTPSEYRRVLMGFKKWRYLSNGLIGTDSTPTCFKYQRSKLYFGTVCGELKLIDFENEKTVKTVLTSGSGRILSIDIKQDILVTGHYDGSIRIYQGEGTHSSSIQVCSSPVVLTKILSPQPGAVCLLSWSRTGECYLVNSLNSINLIGRFEKLIQIHPTEEIVYIFRFNTDEFSIEANEYQIVVINNISLRADIYNSSTGDFLGYFLLKSEEPLCSDIVGKLLFVGFKNNIEVWDLEDTFIS